MFAALGAAMGLTACEKTTVTNPALTVVAVPGPAGAPGATGADGVKGDTGGDTVVIVSSK